MDLWRLWAYNIYARGLLRVRCCDVHVCMEKRVVLGVVDLFAFALLSPRH